MKNKQVKAEIYGCKWVLYNLSRAERLNLVSCVGGNKDKKRPGPDFMQWSQECLIWHLDVQFMLLHSVFCGLRIGVTELKPTMIA